MLARIGIRNFVLIDEAEVRFAPGLNVLSGETGGGKSIVAAAVGLLAGQRGRPDFVRKGSGRCEVAGEFAAGGEGSAPREVVREIDGAGKGRCWIDGKEAPLARLRDEVGRLLCVTSQHEQVSLTRSDVHRDLLDEFAGLPGARAGVAELFAAWRKARERADGLRRALGERESRIDLLRFQSGEIRRAGLAAGEEEELRRRLAVAKNREKVDRALASCFAELFDSDDAAGARVGRAARELEKTAAGVEGLGEPARLLSDALGLLGEAERLLRGIAGEAGDDERAVDGLQERLWSIERLKKKHGATVEEVLRRLGEMDAELARLGNLDVSIGDAERELAAAGAALEAAARALSAARARGGEKLRRAVRRELGDLAMKGVEFGVDVRCRAELAPGEGGGGPGAWIDETGGDEVEFLLRPNEGEDMAPLRRIASGGELSRVLLALKAALRSSGGGETFLFDEVDAGIGGASAEAVGRKLALMGRHNQVLCITHLPQIAAWADRHFLVGKNVRGGRTLTSIRQVEGEERVEELARMLGGETITKKHRDVAGEMLLGARAAKEKR